MSDNEDKEDKPIRAQLAAAFLGRTFIDGGVGENQLAAANPDRTKRVSPSLAV